MNYYRSLGSHAHNRFFFGAPFIGGLVGGLIGGGIGSALFRPRPFYPYPPPVPYYPYGPRPYPGPYPYGPYGY